VEFLVTIDVRWPPDGDTATKEALILAEASRSQELAQAGHLKRLWRRPGAWANVGLWEAVDATELHDKLSSLPFYPWLDIIVQPLARHPSDPARSGQEAM